MNDAERLGEVRTWLRHAHEDLTAAEAMAGADDVRPRHACFLAQQAAEKALKSALVFLQVEYPFLHDLDAIRSRLPDGWLVKQEHPDLALLTECGEPGVQRWNRRRIARPVRPKSSGPRMIWTVWHACPRALAGWA